IDTMSAILSGLSSLRSAGVWDGSGALTRPACPAQPDPPSRPASIARAKPRAEVPAGPPLARPPAQGTKSPRSKTRDRASKDLIVIIEALHDQLPDSVPTVSGFQRILDAPGGP